MAVFRRPVSALRAMAVSQQILANPPNGERPLQLKAAIHAGHSIAVTLNERLDYFGTNINIAARLEKFSQGNDLISPILSTAILKCRNLSMMPTPRCRPTPLRHS